MTALSFPVRIEQDPDDGLFYVRCTALQGCHTFGTTRDEALEKIKQVILGHLAVSLHVGDNALAEEGGVEVVELVA